MSDAQWLQRLHEYGLLHASFRPQAEIAGLRAYLGRRERVLDYAAAHIQHMQKAMMQMNCNSSRIAPTRRTIAASFGEYPDDVGPAFDLATRPLDRVGRMQLYPMRWCEVHVGEASSAWSMKVALAGLAASARTGFRGGFVLPARRLCR